MRKPLLTSALLAVVAASCGSADGGSTRQQTAEPAPATTTTLLATTTTIQPPAARTVCVAAIGELPATDPATLPGTERTDAFGVAQVWVPAGEFTMGTADPAALDPPAFATRELASEQPAHDVALTNGFWIDKYEVTNSAFQAFVDAGGYDDRACWSDEGWAWRQSQTTLPKECETSATDHPRACVTWFEGEAYAIWRGGSLPTEAQWEFAARGPVSSLYPWGDGWDPSRANVVDATGTVPVGSHPDGVSWVGAHDMSGNVMEWVADWLGEDYYASSPSSDPTGPADGQIKVEKGGWWGNVPYVARAAYRHFEDPPDYQDKHIGFRLVYG